LSKSRSLSLSLYFCFQGYRAFGIRTFLLSLKSLLSFGDCVLKFRAWALPPCAVKVTRNCSKECLLGLSFLGAQAPVALKVGRGCSSLFYLFYLFIFFYFPSFLYIFYFFRFCHSAFAAAAAAAFVVLPFHTHTRTFARSSSPLSLSARCSNCHLGCPLPGFVVSFRRFPAC